MSFSLVRGIMLPLGSEETPTVCGKGPAAGLDDLVRPEAEVIALRRSDGRPLVMLAVDKAATYEDLTEAVEVLTRVPGGQEDATLSAVLATVCAAVALRASVAIAVGRT